MLTDNYKIIRGEFRDYLRNSVGLRKTMLQNAINAIENNLPGLVKQNIRNDFECIYDEVYTIRDLLEFSSVLESDSEFSVNHTGGYMSINALNWYIDFYANKQGILPSTIDTIKKEISDSKADLQLFEGQLSEAKILRRRRNINARNQCLKDSGYTCYVCGFNFEKVYGEIGKNFLEVHHLKPISSYTEEHIIPQSELCALCSNCHSIVHRTKPPLDVEVLKQAIKKNFLDM